MQGGFQKISRVRSFLGGTKWYLSEDCLLAAKQVMYAVEYRRFYLRDVESIVVWPSRVWFLRPIIPGVVFGAISAVLWHWVNFTAGAIVAAVGVAWVGLELVLGPTAGARIQATGATVELPLVKRARRAGKVLEKIDMAVRSARGSLAVNPTAPAAGAQQMQTSVASNSEAASAGAPVGDLT